MSYRSLRFFLPRLLAAAAVLSAPFAAQAQTVEYSTSHREHTHAVEQTVKAAPKMAAKLSSRRSPVSLAIAAVLQPGTPDLLSGYATSTGGAVLLQRGAQEATAPTANEAAVIDAGGHVAPFRSAALAIEVPVRPDVLLAEDLRGQGKIDLAVAQRGQHAIVFLAGHGDGTFDAPQILAVRGAVSAVASWRAPSGETLLAAAVTGGQGANGLELVDLQGAEKAFVPVEGSVTGLQLARVNQHGLDDVLLIAGGRALLLDGASVLNGQPRVEALPVEGALAAVSGNFVWDKRPFAQIAVLSSDGAMHILARAGHDNGDLPDDFKALIRAHRTGLTPEMMPVSNPAGLGWAEVETVAGFGAPGATAPLLLKGHLAAGGSGDDLAVLSGGRYLELRHSIAEPAEGKRITTPTLTIDTAGTESVHAAVLARVSADSRLGVITASSIANQPFVSVPSTHTTYYVNDLTDELNAGAGRCTSNLALNAAPKCSLRDAVALANADVNGTNQSSVDVIRIPAGTITTAIQNTTGTQLGDKNYHYNLDTNVNLVGAGCPTVNGQAAKGCTGGTIIDGANKDKIFACNSSNVNSARTLAIFMSGMQLQNGTNSGNGYDTAGGLISFDTQGSGTLTLNQVYLYKGYESGDAGGAVATYNSVRTSVGNVEIDNSVLDSNTTTLFTYGTPIGGGLQLVNNESLVLSNDSFIGNVANYTNANLNSGVGGGMALYPDPSASATKTVTNVRFDSNSAYFTGGGINDQGGGNFSNLTLTNNKLIDTGANDANQGAGGFFSLGPDNLVITYATVTGNSIANTNGKSSGAGLWFSGDAGSGSGTQSVRYSRILGNTGGVSNQTGLSVGSVGTSNTATQTVTATDNWWGCNTDPQSTSAPCNIAHSNFVNTSLTTAPFTTLTVTLNSTSPAANSTIIATGSLNQDSSGTPYGTSNDVAYIGLPATLVITKANASTASSSATVLNSTAQIQASTTADSAGTGKATATVDGFSVLTNFTVIAPDLTVTSSHSGNFKAGDAADTYTLTVGNSGTASTSGTVSLTDTLPSVFTATAISGTGWNCTLANLTCTRSDALAASVTYPAVTLTVSVSSSAGGTYNNSVAVTGGNELSTGNDTGTDSTIVVAPPTISEAFSPTSVAANTNSTVTFTVGNPSANAVSLTGAAFSDPLPSGLKLANPSNATTTCSGGTVSAPAGGSTLSLSGASIASGATCTVSASVVSTTPGSYTNTTGAVSATNSNAGGNASATLTVVVAPTRLVFTMGPATPITAGGNPGTVQVSLEDAAGNVATNNSSTVVSIAVSGFAQPYSATASNGVATFNLSSLQVTTAGTTTYTASGGSLTNGTANETVNPAALNNFGFTGTAVYNAPLQTGSSTFTVRDVYGNTITGFTGTVTLTSNDPLAPFNPTTYTYTAADAGVHTFATAFGTAGTTRTITITSGSVTNTIINIQVNDCILFINSNGTLSRATDVGGFTSPSTGYSGGGAPTIGIAVDSTGNIWSVNPTSGVLAEFSKTGTALSGSGYTGGGLSAPNAVAIDGLGYVWVVNGNNTVSVFTNAGAAVSSVALPVANAAGANAIAIDLSGNIWITGSTSNTVTQIIGGAAPAPPISTGVLNATMGARP